MTGPLRTERLTLLPLAEAHRAEFMRVHEISREHFRPWFPRTSTDRPLDQLFEDELTRAQRGAEAGTDARFVGMMESGAIGGFFALNQIVRRAFLSAYAGWHVSVDQIGKGLGTEGVLGLLDLAFAPEPLGLALHRVQANVIPANVASVRVAEKSGFRLEGTALRYLQIDGRWQDHSMFAKTVEEHAPRYLV